jgi:aminoglycoside phosphotransferase (APT) family kinase protein
MSSADASTAEEVPDLGPVPKRIAVDNDVVRGLVAEQFPRWSQLPIAPVSNGGWDNFTFHLGDDMLIRLPSAAEYALAVEKERRWLPELARHVSVPIPSPCGNGVPGDGYPYPWSIYRWLDGDRATRDGIVDPAQFAVALADFLASLRRIEATDGPQPGLHNWYRGATLRTYDKTAQESLAALAGHIDVDLATEIWSAALSARWDGVDVWFHGDLAEGNLLLKNGGLAAVIDFGTCGVGDPACDLAIAWTLLTEPGRRVFRDRLAVDDASWARGRGWALWKTLSQLAAAITDSDADQASESRRVLDEIAAEYSTRMR